MDLPTKPHAPGVVVSLNTPDVPLDRNEFEGFVPGGDSTVLHFDVEEVVRISPADQQSDTIVTVSISATCPVMLKKFTKPLESLKLRTFF
jgi:hypothetical protein